MIDSHCHITDKAINAAEVISSMKSDGLKKLVTVGYDMPSSEAAYKLAAENEDVYCAVGFHPSDVGGIKDDSLDKLLEFSRGEKTVAIGEIGLDYHYPDTDRDAQKYWLCRQLELVKASGLPAIFHLRDAYEDMLTIIKSNLDKLPARGVMHCFSGSAETAKIYADLGFYVSFSGTVTFKNARNPVEAAKIVPDDLILVETDCPYLAPEPFRGKTNVPALVRYTLGKVAQIRGVDFDYAERLTEKNTMTLFSKMKR